MAGHRANLAPDDVFDIRCFFMPINQKPHILLSGQADHNFEPVPLRHIQLCARRNRMRNPNRVDACLSHLPLWKF